MRLLYGTHADIAMFGFGDGYGDGHGYGCGYGDGHGYGHGYGDDNPELAGFTQTEE